MTYLCGLSGFGPSDREPQIVCDGCGRVYFCRFRSAPPKWFFDKKPPPKWSKTITGESDGTRRDYCPDCKEPKR